MEDVARFSRPSAPTKFFYFLISSHTKRVFGLGDVFFNRPYRHFCEILLLAHNIEALDIDSPVRELPRYLAEFAWPIHHLVYYGLGFLDFHIGNPGHRLNSASHVVGNDPEHRLASEAVSRYRLDIHS